MIPKNEFTLQQIIWAKVPNYPWWPAKIINKFSTNNSNIYKVNFFGDPTQQMSIQCSCFLQSQYISHFDNDLIKKQSQTQNLQFLKRPIQLAKLAYNKNKNNLNIANSFPSLPENKSQIFQQSKLATNDLNILFHQQTWESNKIQFQPVTSEQDKIYYENTPQPIENSTFKQSNHKESKGYNNKKEAIRMHSEFKQQILSKYTLLHIPKVQDKTKPIHLPISRNRSKNQKAKDKNFMKFAFRKLLKILLVQFECTSSRARQVTEKIMSSLQSTYGNNRKQLGKQFMNWVNLRISSRSIDQYLYNICEKEEIYYLDIEEETKKEEKLRSKIPSIGSFIH